MLERKIEHWEKKVFNRGDGRAVMRWLRWTPEGVHSSIKSRRVEKQDNSGRGPSSVCCARLEASCPPECERRADNEVPPSVFRSWKLRHGETPGGRKYHPKALR